VPDLVIALGRWIVVRNRFALSLAAALVLVAGAAGAQQQPQMPRLPPNFDFAQAGWFARGETVWIDAPDGRVKTRAYQSEKMGERPVLVVLIHGDIPDPRQGLYELADAIAHISDNVVAAGLLRPGYKDAKGDTSAGKMGFAIGDNYTPQVIDDVDAAIRQLKARYHAGKVVMIGHSGGGAIIADLMGRHPGDVDAAVLLSCGCDPKEFMVRFIREHPNPDFPKDPVNPSLLPIEEARHVPPRMHVRMVIGDQDQVVRLADSQAYLKVLQDRGVDAKLVIAPGVGHNDVFRATQTRDAVVEALTLEGANVRPPEPSLLAAVRF
jgi:pimeloyl-ACP methyl ester carboxylesterase